MIQVTRGAKPKVLQKNEAKWVVAIKTAVAAKDKVALDKAIAKYKHDEIKTALTDMLHGKCAFCESYIENVDFGDIEHYRPKSKFPAKAVEWTNLLLSCKKCNGSGQKGSQWPTAQKGGPLINPASESPAVFFSFLYDEVAQVTVVKPKNIRGRTSEKIYGLNKLGLLKDRNTYVRSLVALAKYYHRDNEAKEILDAAVEDSGEYAAFARMVKRKYV